MGKNIGGGNRHKKQARKNTTVASNSHVRTSNDDYEIYAIATQMLGNNMFHCEGIDGIKRLCHIRKNFSGRGRRHSEITLGTWVLVGVREWDQAKETERVRKNKIPQCDVLTVYTDAERRQLTETVSAPWSRLQTHADAMSGASAPGSSAHPAYDPASAETDIQFSTVDLEEQQRLMSAVANTSVEKITFTDTDGDDINIDDI